MNNPIRQETKKIRRILGRIKRKDLKGNSGQAIKNSSYQLATTFVAKTGALFFTIVMARLLGPEIYGIYGLALSTILFIAVFSDLGITQALMTFLSRTIDNNPGKAKGYFYFLTKYKILLILLPSTILLISAKWLANIYGQPIYYALLAGAIYLPIATFSGYLSSIFATKNNFRPDLIREIIIQVSRLTIAPFFIIYFLSRISSTEIYLLYIFLLLSSFYLIGGIYLFIVAKSSHLFNKAKAKKLNSKEKKELIIFILPLSLTAFSGIFFGYIDQIMLGLNAIESQFLGFYHISINLVASASVLLAFTSSAIFPIFARLKSKQLERGFKKTRNITILISISAAIFTFLIAPFAIQIIYGKEYMTAVNFLRILSPLLISFPLAGLYITYYTSQKKTKLISILLFLSTLLNIVLNHIFINIGLRYSEFHAVVGVCIATIISRYFYLLGMILWRKKE